MNLKNFLKSYEINLKYFDLESFEDEIMDMPYQIQVLKEHINDLSEQDKRMFFYLNKKLKEKIKNVKPKNGLQNKIIFELKKIL